MALAHLLGMSLSNLAQPRKENLKWGPPSHVKHLQDLGKSQESFNKPSKLSQQGFAYS